MSKKNALNTCQSWPSAENSPSRRSGGGTGRHVRLRGVCRKACGFKSRPEHHSKIEFKASFATTSQHKSRGKCSAGTSKCSGRLCKCLSANGRDFLLSMRYAQLN